MTALERMNTLNVWATLAPGHYQLSLAFALFYERRRK